MPDSQKRIHVVINPAAGKDEPILNVINDIFKQYKVKWSVSVTQESGEATEFARVAAENGFDIVAGYGGDGTQHEIANGILGTGAVMGVLPGGTGNNFSKELGTPQTLRPAVELLCTGNRVRDVDVVKMNEECFILRLLVGVEPETETTREEKNKFGKLAYLWESIRNTRDLQELQYRITIDGEYIEAPGMALYVVNAAKNDAGISFLGKFSSIDDGVMDAFILNRNDIKTFTSLADRMLNLDTQKARDYVRHGKEMTIETDPDQPVWMDGEYSGRTPIYLKVLPAALPVVVPEKPKT